MVAEGGRGPMDHDDDAIPSKTSPTARLCSTVSLMSNASNLALHDLDWVPVLNVGLQGTIDRQRPNLWEGSS